ncbi:MAG TPA: GNAT family N-acetyltransferase [Acidimicrobiales bacterium]|nr:GNAT family N-acetyltransferase [Acidimicrobiales bacterium]
MNIRDGRDDDWPSFFPIFSAIIAAGESYAYPLGLASDEARALWMEQPPCRVLMAIEGGRIVGSAKAGPNRPGRGAHVATASFMVDPNARGRGVGRALALEVLSWARREGYAAMQFNAVVETNAAAVGLWRSLGFEILTTVPEAFDSASNGLVGLHVMYQKL